MARVLIAYATRKGATKAIADRIAEGIRSAGVEVKMVAAADVKSASDLEGFDGFVFGSATYHGEMMQPMKTMLFLPEKLQHLEAKIGGAFGAFGWSGEASIRIFETMQHIFKMNMADGPLRVKNVGQDGGAGEARDYGRQIAEKLSS